MHTSRRLLRGIGTGTSYINHPKYVTAAINPVLICVPLTLRLLGLERLHLRLDLLGYFGAGEEVVPYFSRIRHTHFVIVNQKNKLQSKNDQKDMPQQRRKYDCMRSSPLKIPNGLMNMGG